MSEKKHLYVVFFEPNGVPKTADGSWAGILGVFEYEGDAKAEIDRIKYESLKDEEEWGWLGRFEKPKDHEESDVSNRQLRLSYEPAEFTPKSCQGS